MLVHLIQNGIDASALQMRDDAHHVGGTEGLGSEAQIVELALTHVARIDEGI
ncbi:hypothetical protein D3C83_300930 [compost metagenome]